MSDQKPKSAFDIKRMEIALASERYKIPKGLSVEEIRKYILSKAKGQESKQ